MATPVANGLVAGVFERLVAALYRYHLGSEQAHLLHVRPLTGHVGGAHIDHAGHLHQGADRRRGHAVLTGSRLGHNAGFAHTACQ